MKNIRQWLYCVLFSPESAMERAASWLLMFLILSNICVVEIATLPDLSLGVVRVLSLVNNILLIIFLFEYIARVWSAVEDSRFAGHIRGRLKYMRRPFSVIDLLAILPGLLPILGVPQLDVLRVLRVLRVFSILRLGRYSSALRLFGNVFIAKRGELAALVMVIGVALLMSATLMYHLEHSVQPERFRSIPESLWWAVITLTTVGYGDVAPVTPLGRVMGGLIALLGIGVAALPAGILASGLHEQMLEARRRKCGDGINGLSESREGEVA